MLPASAPNDVGMPDDATPDIPPPTPAAPQASPPARMPAVGVIGEPRSAGMTILLFFVTCGIWGLVWNYWVFEENKKWSGEGIGGVLGLVLWLFVAPVNFFLLPNEIERMYQADGRTSPVTTLYGLWFLLPIVGFIIWILKMQHALNDFWESKGAAPA